MKKLLLVLLISLISFQGFTQDPDLELFKTWYLINIEYDIEGGLDVSSINPHISPTLTINEQLGFEGFGACNSFSGEFAYLFENNVETLTPFNYIETLDICENQEHTNFENNYFDYFESEQPSLRIIYVDLHNLVLEKYPGFTLNYSNEPLAIEIFPIDTINIYPNPVSNTLYISSENTVIEKVAVYNISGQIVLKQNNIQNNSIDVSSLSEGMYFLELTSDTGKALKKFMKK